MRYSEELIEEVRSRNDIVDVISGYVQLKKKGSSHFGLCPFHNEKSPSFSVSQSKQIFYCFGCGAGGNVISFIMKYENDTFTEALQRLAERAGIKLPEAELSKEERRAQELRSSILAINKEAARFFFHQLKSPSGANAYRYLRGRELSDETIIRFGLGFAGKDGKTLYRHLREMGYSDDLLKESGLFTFRENGVLDKFWNRVMFPIMDTNSRVIGFGGRVMGKGEPKYLNSPETIAFDKSRNLYGLQIAKTSKRPYLILCEGYMDVISMHQAGFSNAVASLGTSLTSGQASLIKRYAKEVLLSYDSDGAGVKAALRAIPILNDAGIAVRVIDLAPHKDPDEFMKALGQEAFEERIRNAENSFLFEIRMMSRSYNLTDPAGKTSFYLDVSQKLVESFPDELERDNYLESVSRTFAIPLDGLRSNVKQRLLTYHGQKGSRENEPAAKRRSKTKESSVIQAQKLLLTWLVDEPEVYSKIKTYLTPEDFESELYKRAAEQLFSQIESGAVVPAKIISGFTDESEQEEIASLFQTELGLEMTLKEKEKAFNDIFRKVKKNSIEVRMKTVAPEKLKDVYKEELELRKLIIRFDA